MSSGLLDDQAAGYGAPVVHPLVALTDALETLLDDAGAANAWTMTPTELQEILPRLTWAETRLAEVKLRVLREADRQSVGEDVGATNTPAWWARVTGQRVPPAPPPHWPRSSMRATRPPGPRSRPAG